MRKYRGISASGKTAFLAVGLLVALMATTTPSHAFFEPMPTSVWPMPAKFESGKNIYVLANIVQVEFAKPSSCLYEEVIGAILFWGLPDKALFPKFEFVKGKKGSDILIDVTAKMFNFTIHDKSFTTEDFVENDKSFFKSNEYVKLAPVSRAFTINKFYVSVNEPESCANLSISTDESYKLSVVSEKRRVAALKSEKNATLLITASTYQGVIRAMASFVQMLYLRGTYVAVADFTISDQPRFPHRGILMDTARHFLSTSVIKEMIFIMAMNKMNVLHWHIVDDQSFPYQSERFPSLFVQGAYIPIHNHGYSLKTISNIVEFAKLLGVRVVPEFDTPGHSQSWRGMDPNFLSKCYGSDGKPNGNVDNIDPTNENNYKLLGELFQEVKKTFPDDFMHIGGDEVNPNCWESNPNIKEFMKKNSIKNGAELQTYFSTRLEKVLAASYSKLVAWEEVFENGGGLSNGTAVYHVWKSPTTKVKQVLNANHYAIYSSCWYLDVISRSSDWRKYYSCEPLNFLSGEDDPRFLGGEACLWGEFIDGGNLATFAWPRASAIAERLWSPKSVNNVYAAAPRINDFRCFLQKNGVPAWANTGPGIPCYNEFDPISYVRLYVVIKTLSTYASQHSHVVHRKFL